MHMTDDSKAKNYTEFILVIFNVYVT